MTIDVLAQLVQSGDTRLYDHERRLLLSYLALTKLANSDSATTADGDAILASVRRIGVNAAQIASDIQILRAGTLQKSYNRRRRYRLWKQPVSESALLLRMEHIQSYRDAGNHHLDTNESSALAIDICRRAEDMALKIIRDVEDPPLRKSVVVVYTAAGTVLVGVVTALAAAGVMKFAA